MQLRGAKRLAAVEDAGDIVKPGEGVRTRGLAIRKTSATNADAQPPTKLQKLQPTTVVRPKTVSAKTDQERFVQDYAEDVNEYLFEVEEGRLVDELFLSKKTVTSKMRSILIDWMMQVQQRLRLETETLHLAVFIVDRFLESVKVDKNELQLVGVCAILIASKYEEVEVPTLLEMRDITADAFTRQQITQMEPRVWRVSGFEYGQPNSIHFVHCFSQKAAAPNSVVALAKYLAEMCLLCHSFSSIKASHIAAGALWLANQIKGSGLNLKGVYESVAEEGLMEEAVETGKMIADWVVRVRGVGKLVACTDKYAASKLCQASKLSDAEVADLRKLAV